MRVIRSLLVNRRERGLGQKVARSVVAHVAKISLCLACPGCPRRLATAAKITARDSLGTVYYTKRHECKNMQTRARPEATIEHN